MIKVVPGILTGSNDASSTQMPMQEDAGYVARDVAHPLVLSVALCRSLLVLF
jgi:hypothetical protein